MFAGQLQTEPSPVILSLWGAGILPGYLLLIPTYFFIKLFLSACMSVHYSLVWCLGRPVLDPPWIVGKGDYEPPCRC